MNLYLWGLFIYGLLTFIVTIALTKYGKTDGDWQGLVSRDYLAAIITGVLHGLIWPLSLINFIIGCFGLPFIMLYAVYDATEYTLNIVLDYINEKPSALI